MSKTQSCGRFALSLFVLAIGVATVARAQTFSVLYNFGSKSGDPANPVISGILAQGRDGNLYSAAPVGGANNLGAVFKITPAGMLSVLYSFDGTHGSSPYGGLTLGRDGNFYGTTYSGGTSNDGTVFKITSSGSLTVLHNFTNGSDEERPLAPPVQGTDGNFYGTTCGDCQGAAAPSGTIYKITPSGTFTTLFQFNNTPGRYPAAPLVQATNGDFYGTTPYGGGTYDCGVVFKITPAGKFMELYNFDCAQGANPFGPLVQGSGGNFYGTTLEGGTGYGIVFKITPTGSLTILHDMNGGTDGGLPYAGLVKATDGNFYGANISGGVGSSGTIFKITPKGSYSVLYNFDDTTGLAPEVTPFQLTNGVVYGDTFEGGTGNVSPCSTGSCGVFYSLNVGLKPFVTLLPYSGKVGKTIEFVGQGFTSSTTVSFNGTPATPSVKSGTYLIAPVPSGATTGFVTVMSSKGTLTSNKIFRVTPQLTSFMPTSGPVGTFVTITGVSLTQTTKVTFGGVKATTDSVVNDMKVTATVPTGAKTGHIAITTPGGTATSAAVFTVTQ